MKQIAVDLPDDLGDRLQQEANRRGTTVAEFTREAIEAHIEAPQRSLGAAAAGRSGRSDISERIQELVQVAPPG